ncbi:NADH:flavin oxidoreductase [Bradyrhizobium elkanii]|uniref:NADH:flavin oxidoreductase n=1 Tax=Bradyrhizobium elkanii TaxID=29448 RepID=UPI002714DAB4|nr:NADH:flavin oxidoreductase [Bradyrhizobium elkanii]WLB09524.1 NADH:flavin oxidoreductase [Bradyrhizobium elkanii]WLB72528.1 NADH:flavin oxidoreductase [Bradyrhizobium elkanii]
MNAAIFEPIDWRNLKVKNRIFRSSISGRFDNEDGSGTQTRINWEEKFARGGVGAIISSYVPVTLEGRIMSGYATVHTDDFIPFWRRLGASVHRHDCRFIMQLSHSGRQQDVPGIVNQHRKVLSSTSRTESLHGFPCQAMTTAQVRETVQAFAQGARRARAAGLDGVELHGANGYLITQFLSSGINDRRDEYGGSLENRARFVREIVRAIRIECGADFHLQVKISAIDYNNVIPTEGRGNTLEDSIQVCKWLEQDGADALHISTGSLFPHPLNPPGDFSFNTIANTYENMISSGVYTLRNYFLFRYRFLRWIFYLIWFRQKWGKPVQGVGADAAAAIKKQVNIPVISAGGWQSGATISEAIGSGKFDAVSIARSLIANNDLVKQYARGLDLPDRPCTYCNKCLLNAPKNPLGCYEQNRFGGDYDRMVREILTVFEVPPGHWDGPPPPPPPSLS